MLPERLLVFLRFESARPGYQFQLGAMGVGYYWYGGKAGEAAAAAAKRAANSDDSESERCVWIMDILIVHL